MQQPSPGTSYSLEGPGTIDPCKNCADPACLRHEHAICPASLYILAERGALAITKIAPLVHWPASCMQACVHLPPHVHVSHKQTCYASVCMRFAGTDLAGKSAQYWPACRIGLENGESLW